MEPESPGNGGGAGGTNGRGGSGGSVLTNGGTGGSRPDNPIDSIPGVTDPIDVPPDGCLESASATNVSLRLDAEIPSVLLEATDGNLHANGIACTDAGGAEIPVTSLLALNVSSNGTTESGAILDLASGDWSALLEHPEAIKVQLGRGTNGLVVRGTPGADTFRHGMRGAELALDLVGDGRINLLASGLTTLGLSMAAGDDIVDDLAALRAQILAEAEAQAEVDGTEPPDFGDPVTALNLPLIATGGEGNDWLLGGLLNDDFEGGPGDDVMSGLDGDDSMYTDELDGTDIYNGGAGYDSASYELRTADLAIELCVSPATVGCTAPDCTCSVTSGEPGEGDLLVNVDDVSAGSGDDVLRGTDAADSLNGGPGDDELYGLGGSDLLYGEGGDDLLDGGPDGDYCSGAGGDQVMNCEL